MRQLFKIFLWINRSGAESASKGGEGFDNLRRPLGQLFVAEGAVVGLEDGADEVRVDAGVFLLVAPDFDGLEGLEFGDGQGLDSGGDGVPLDCVREDEGEVAFDGLEAGDFAGGDSFEREFVEACQVDLGKEDGLAELAGFQLRGG